MARLVRMLKKKALQVAPEPEKDSIHVEEPSNPSVPDGGKADAGQARRWKNLGFLQRKGALSAGTVAGEATTRPKWGWLKKMLNRRDPEQNGSRSQWFCDYWCRKHQPHQTSPEVNLEPPACSNLKDLPHSRGQEAEEPCSSSISLASCPWDSSSSWGSDSTEADGRFCRLPGTPMEEEEGEELGTEEAALSTITEELQGREKDNKRLRFLNAVQIVCFAAQQRGQDTLGPHCSKAAVLQRIVEFIEELPENSPPTDILASSLIAVSHLSKMKPPLETEEDTQLLRAALCAVFTLDTRTDTPHLQSEHEIIEDLLDDMLGCLLEESPGTDRLNYILENISTWLQSREPQERARAVRCSAALLTLTITLPGFNNSAEFVGLGRHVAQMGVLIFHPDEDTSHNARVAIYGLYLILLHQRGLTGNDAGELWCWEWNGDKSLLGYRNTARVGEVFGRFFSGGQRTCFLHTVLLAIHDPLLHVCQAGLLLAYGISGEAEQLIGGEVGDVRARIMHELRVIRSLRQVPEALQGMFQTRCP